MLKKCIIHKTVLRHFLDNSYVLATNDPLRSRHLCSAIMLCLLTSLAIWVTLKGEKWVHLGVLNVMY